jgi:pimeloyl-ACP methyl ester carboxylesterase
MPHATINGAKLWYDSMGEGEPILLHHGYTASRINWLPIAERLKDRYRILMMECRGTGESADTQDGYNIEQYTSDVIGMMDYLEIPTFTFAGHSMGGGIGYLLGISHSARLNKLVLMAPIPSGGISGEPNWENINTRMTARKEGNRDYFKSEMIATRFRADVQTDEWFESRVDHLMRVSEGHVLGGMASMYALRAEHHLTEIKVPTLMLSGAVDGLLAANLADFQKLPNATLQVFSHAGHDVAIHEPDGVSDSIDKFMRYGVVSTPA